MKPFDQKSEPKFVKTGDIIVDAIIKFSIYNPEIVVIFSTIFINVYLFTTILLYKFFWLLVPMIMFSIFVIIISNYTKFSDRLFDKIPNINGFRYDMKTYYQYQYEYTEDLNKKNIK